MKKRYYYYTVKIPWEAARHLSMEDLHECAVSIAKERTRIYTIPAVWTSKILSDAIGGPENLEAVFRVCRIS